MGGVGINGVKWGVPIPNRPEAQSNWTKTNNSQSHQKTFYNLQVSILGPLAAAMGAGGGVEGGRQHALHHPLKGVLQCGTFGGQGRHV